jgi:hypothetical protein
MRWWTWNQHLVFLDSHLVSYHERYTMISFSCIVVSISIRFALFGSFDHEILCLSQSLCHVLLHHLFFSFDSFLVFRRNLSWGDHDTSWISFFLSPFVFCSPWLSWIFLVQKKGSHEQQDMTCPSRSVLRRKSVGMRWTDKSNRESTCKMTRIFENQRRSNEFFSRFRTWVLPEIVFHSSCVSFAFNSLTCISFCLSFLCFIIFIPIPSEPFDWGTKILFSFPETLWWSRLWSSVKCLQRIFPVELNVRPFVFFYFFIRTIWRPEPSVGRDVVYEIEWMIRQSIQTLHAVTFKWDSIVKRHSMWSQEEKRCLASRAD